MTEDWRKGYLTAINNEGCRSAWQTGAFIATQTEPYHIHRTTGMKFYLALEEVRQNHRKQSPYHRIYSVGVAQDGSQSGECSDYTAVITGDDFPPILERFDQFQRFAISRYKRLYLQHASQGDE